MEKERNMGYPRWVEDELWNWSRWCWLGDWPQPDPNVKCLGRTGLRAPAGPDDEPAPIPAYGPRAQGAKLYDSLAHVEQRVLQAEYPRRHEYAGLTAGERITRPATGWTSPVYYKIALGHMKDQVRRAFQ